MIMLAVLVLLGAAEIQSSVDGGAYKPGWVYARVGQTVVMRAPSGTAHTWFELRPTDASVDNTQPAFHFAQVHFETVELERCRGSQTCEALGPGLPPAQGAGTTAYQVTLTDGAGRAVESPGLKATRYGGLTREVHRVTFRLDDSYLGYLTELIGTPYIFGSAGPDGRNQTDLLIGADCADLAVYGQRRLGAKAEYTSSYQLDRQAPEVKGPVRKGDVLHFPGSRHVAVLWEDRPPLGVLDENDLMLHTCWAPPTIEPIRANPSCASKPWRVLRFR